MRPESGNPGCPEKNFRSATPLPEWFCRIFKNVEKIRADFFGLPIAPLKGNIIAR
jgi:hypothetical protein